MANSCSADSKVPECVKKFGVLAKRTGIQGWSVLIIRVGDILSPDGLWALLACGVPGTHAARFDIDGWHYQEEWEGKSRGPSFAWCCSAPANAISLGKVCYTHSSASQRVSETACRFQQGHGAGKCWRLQEDALSTASKFRRGVVGGPSGQLHRHLR